LKHINNNIAQSEIQNWVSAARLRTLPLALASIGMGNLICLGHPAFRQGVFFLALLTTVFMQVLSNFANDLGDSEHGADHAKRQGPARTIQAGLISRMAMKRAVLLMAVLSLISGMVLLWQAFAGNWSEAFPLFAAGLLSIAAAWYYTNGKKPYGYLALGDLAVFLFFGLLAVLGIVWLQLQEFRLVFLLPACTSGCWSVAVMNLNNMRDLESDAAAGKRSVPMLLGKTGSRVYQTILVLGGILCVLIFWWPVNKVLLAGALPGVLLMLRTLPVVWQEDAPPKLDRLLKPQALGTFISVAGMYLAWYLAQFS
jgi:1,4-dihydroxy-2-naphthoate octaprenyltransferase